MPGLLDDPQSTVGADEFFVWTSGDGYTGDTSLALPAVGCDVDGVILDETHSANPVGTFNGSACPYAAIPSATFRLPTAAAITAGQLLETNASGQAVPHSTGIAVPRAPQSAGSSGIVIGAVFTSGR